MYWFCYAVLGMYEAMDNEIAVKKSKWETPDQLSQEITHNYARFCQPGIAESMDALCLSKIYHRSSAAYLWYWDGVSERKVYDFLGGYGAGLFGHNHSSLIQQTQKFFAEQRPFLAQLSNRSEAGNLAAKLNNILKPITGKQYIVKQANSGAEAVEVAIKHALLSYNKKTAQFLLKSHDENKAVLQKIRSRALHVSRQFRTAACQYLDLTSDLSTTALFNEISIHNRKVANSSPVFLSLKSAFHGKSSGASQLSYNINYKRGCEANGLNNIFVRSGDISELKETLKHTKNLYFTISVEDDSKVYLRKYKRSNVAGFFIEPLQGEGGIHIIPSGYLSQCRDMANANNFPLIADEIQCGMGRTGTFLFSQQQNFVADYYLLSKSLGGGIAKISTVLIEKNQYINEFDLLYSSTFAEDDFSSNIAFHALSLLTDTPTLMDNCKDRGYYLLASLNSLKKRYGTVIKDVRGIGLMLGVEFHTKNYTSPALKTLAQQQLLSYVITGYLLNEHDIRVAPTLSSELTIRLEPPALILEHDCDVLIRALDRICNILEKQNVYELVKYIIGIRTLPHFHKNIKDYRVNLAPRQCIKGLPRVAFIAHFIESKDIVLWEKSLEQFSATQLNTLVNKLGPLLNPVIVDQQTITSTTGDKVNLDFIGLCYDSISMSKNIKRSHRKHIIEKIQYAVDLAESRGCDVIGLGGYISIITNNGKKLRTERAGLTTGNALTVAMGVDALLKTASDRSLKLQDCCFAAIGAVGNIGSIYCKLMAQSVPQIILIGKPHSRSRLVDLACSIYSMVFVEITHNIEHKKTDVNAELAGIARVIYATETVAKLLQQSNLSHESIGKDIFQGLERELHADVPIKISMSPEAINSADIVLSASNCSHPVIFPYMPKKSPVIICDIAVPMDTDVSVLKSCPWITVFQGGVVRLPLDPNYQINGLPLEKGVSFACNAETLLLGLSGMKDNYSYGEITYKQVKKISKIAEMHGFTLARLKTEKSY